MEYLFLRRKRTTATSERQKTLLFKAAERQWKEEFAGKETDIRKGDCNLKELLNTYRVEYAKELLCSRRCALTELPCSCGFASKSAFYSAFSRIVGVSPLSYQTQERRRHHLQAVN